MPHEVVRSKNSNEIVVQWTKNGEEISIGARKTDETVGIGGTFAAFDRRGANALIAAVRRGRNDACGRDE